MKLIKRGLWSLIPLSIFFATPSCRDCDAYSNPSSYAVGAFYDKNDPSSTLDINFTSVKGIGDGAPEITKMANGKYLLPLKVTSRETGFSFVTEGMADSTYISYETSVKVNGPDCGAYEQLSGLKVSPTQGGAGQDFYRGDVLFDSVAVVVPTVSADTITENIRFVIDVCDSEEKSASRNLIVTYLDSATGNPREESFTSIHVKGNHFAPIYTGSDRFSTIYLPLEGSDSTTFVFRQITNDADTIEQSMKVVFNTSTTISDDATGCIFFDGTGSVLLDSAGTTGKEFIYPQGPHFKRMQIDRTTVNTNPDFPNVKLFI
ncbi:hypothetical protein [Flammeovirga aprica]|uniref:Uncharacterized protein n=1 Tax=Flammeovirga aprica JL-4 TaxID=694437 RepID=A0A7X9RTS0_9BACT|nr:hypothetical protein [Flammeovirga aprica]NME67622.1 hypothetical protein [Flammeovirga aprica JL-4]